MSLQIVIPPRILSFTVIGGVGFFIDASFVSLLVMFYAWDAYSARLVSFTIAVCITWILNRQWTFKSARSQKKSWELTRYYCVQAAGGLINLLIYSFILESIIILQNYPVIPLFFGSIIAMFFNYFAMKNYVFRAGVQNQVEK